MENLEVKKAQDQMKADLQFVQKHLSWGDIKKISAIVPFSREYVRRFFKGEYTVNDKNLCIVDAALLIIGKDQSAADAFHARVKAVLK